jgi:hypothetical protein
VFLVNSRFTRLLEIRRERSLAGFTIFRSYGAILQSSFDTVFPCVLAYDASLSVLIFSTIRTRYFLAP